MVRVKKMVAAPWPQCGSWAHVLHYVLEVIGDSKTSGRGGGVLFLRFLGLSN